jgi:hypothetical protein
LLPQGPIEAELGMDARHGIGRRPPHQHDLDRIARNQMNGKEAHEQRSR